MGWLREARHAQVGQVGQSGGSEGSEAATIQYPQQKLVFDASNLSHLQTPGMFLRAQIHGTPGKMPTTVNPWASLWFPEH